MKVKQKKHLEKLNSNQKGENNRNWKGNEVGYKTLHQWVRRNKPKAEHCEFCKKKLKLEASNISGKYLRDLNDYRWLCRSCHLRYDNVADKARETKRRKRKSEQI